MARILVVRHGHARGNAEHRFIGQTDVPLDDLGRQQSLALAARLRTSPIDRIVSSDLRRAIDTITPLADAVGMEIERDERLREISNGEWSGLLPEEIASGWPDLWAGYRAGEDVPRPSGEQWADVRERVVEAARDHAARGGLIVMCTHGGPALNLALWACGFSPGSNIFTGRLGSLANTSITTIEFGPGDGHAARLIGFNDIGHLEGPTPDSRLAFEPVK
jgi:probable phosphoglycerate mutase